MCGERSYYASFPMPGEEEWAVTIYKQELKDAGLWTPKLSMDTFREIR